MIYYLWRARRRTSSSILSAMHFPTFDIGGVSISSLIGSSRLSISRRPPAYRYSIRTRAVPSINDRLRCLIRHC